MKNISTNYSVYKTLITLYLIVFLNTLGYFLIFPVLSKIVSGQEHNIIPQGWSYYLGDYLFPVILGAGSIASIILAPVVGRWSDLWGRKRLLIVCTLLTILSFVLPIIALLSGSVLLFLIGNAINGIASNNRPVAQAAISDLSQRSRSKVMRYAIDVFIICVAMVVGPEAGYWLSSSEVVTWFNDLTPFVVAGLLTTLAAVLLWQNFPETNRYTSKKLTFNYHSSLGSFSDVIHLRGRAWLILILIFIIQGAWAQFFQYIYIYLPHYLHFSQQASSHYVSLLGVYLSVGLLGILPFLIQWFSRNQIILACAIIACLSFLGLTVWPQLVWWWAVPLAISMAMYYPCTLALLTELGTHREQGWLMTLNSVMLGASWFITAFTAIGLSHVNAQLPILVCTIMMVVASILAGYDCIRHRT